MRDVGFVPLLMPPKRQWGSALAQFFYSGCSFLHRRRCICEKQKRQSATGSAPRDESL